MIEQNPETYDPFVTIIVIALILAFALLGEGCARPEPIVIERKCPFAELNPKSELPAVEFIKPDEGCPFYRCLDKENALKLKEREIRLRNDSNYARELYLDTQKRCETK